MVTMTNRCFIDSYYAQELDLVIPETDLIKIHLQLNEVTKNIQDSEKSITDLTAKVAAWKQSPGKERAKLALIGLACLIGTIALVVLVCYLGPLHPLFTYFILDCNLLGFGIAYHLMFDLCYLSTIILGSGLGVFYVGQSVLQNSKKLESNLQVKTKQLAELAETKSKHVKECENYIKTIKSAKETLEKRSIEYTTHLANPQMKNLVTQGIANNKKIILNIENLLNCYKDIKHLAGQTTDNPPRYDLGYIFAKPVTLLSVATKR